MGAMQIQRAFLSLFRLFQLNIGLSSLPRLVRTGWSLRRYYWYCSQRMDGIAFFALRQT
jgi:hypothetical protein